jgi:serine/threonine protein kinase
MKIFIDKRYTAYGSTINSILRGEYESEVVFCHNRNVVEKVTVDGHEFVVKIFKRPSLFNSFVYSFFRKSKAERAFLYAYRLQNSGFDTATPVAYAYTTRLGLFNVGYFISEYLPYPSISELYKQIDEDEREALKRDFVDFTLRMHEHKIVHRDYNPGNILVHKESDGYHFALIDINRMTFNKVPDMKTSMICLDNLLLDLHGLLELVPLYAEARHFDLEKCILIILMNRQKDAVKHRMKKLFKQKVLRRRVQ